MFFLKSFLSGFIGCKILILFFLIPILAFPQAKQLNLKKSYPILEVEGNIWIGTPDGLYQYNKSDDSFKLFIPPSFEKGMNVKLIYHNEEYLWLVLDSGLAALHLRLNEWLFFDTNNGLPSNNISGLDFQEDYVWISTNNGAARFDLLIEEWEIFDQERQIPDNNLIDIVVSDQLVWFITSDGFSEYTPSFEKWRHFKVQNNEEIVISRSFLLNNDLWMVCNKGLLKFNTELRTQQFFFNDYLNTENLVELVYENNNIQALTSQGLYYIDTENDVIRAFEGNNFLENQLLVNLSFDAKEMWFLTNTKILKWKRDERSFEGLDYASGLSDSLYLNVYVNGGTIFLLNANIVDYKLGETSSWRSYKLSDNSRGLSGGQPFLKNLFDNEEGGNIKIGDYKWKFDGTRINYVYDRKDDGRIIKGERLDVKSQILLKENRNIFGFYNNIDYSETMYGLKYRSRETGDILREINLGDFRKEKALNPYAESASVFGSNIWLQAGEKTPRFKRSKFSLKAQTGELRSKKTYEFYDGATYSISQKINDINYFKNRFFYIPGIEINDKFSDLQVFVDDMIPGNNDNNTAEGNTIANITGDFDLLYKTEDYYFNSSFGLLHINKIVKPEFTVIVRYKKNNQVYEKVLLFNQISTAKQNVYYLHGRNIIPNTFNLNITDSHERFLDISEFGLDNNADGKVDDLFLDYEGGYLMFPEEHPFPEAVYDSLISEPVYKLEINYNTRLSLIKLKNNNLVRGSESLTLDGITASPANDYILDYTNGTVVFVKEGVVNVDTRIEIEYEYYLGDKKEKISGASLNFSPSDNFYIQADWLNFKNSNVHSNDTISNLLTIHNEFRQNIKKVDIRLISGLAFQAEEKSISSYYINGLISTSKFRFQTLYNNYEKSYKNIYHQQSIVGKTKNNLEVFSSAELSKSLRLDGEYKKLVAFANDNSNRPELESANLTALLHKKNLPSLRISYRDISTSTNSLFTRKSFLNSRLEYTLPKSIVKHLPVKSLKTEAYYRTGKQSGKVILGVDKQQFDQQYIRINTNITDQILGSFFYRKYDYNHDRENNVKVPLSRSERFIFNFSQEQWRLLQININLENILDQNFIENSENSSVRFNQYSQLNLRFSPGQIWQKLSSLFFEFNINQSLNSWGSTEDNTGGLLWNIFGNYTDLFDFSLASTNYFIKNEFKPSSNILLYSNLEWNNQDNHSGKSYLSRNFWRLNEKLELKIGYNSRVYFQYKQFYQDWDYNRIYKYFEPSAWIEHRWNNNIQDIFNFRYRKSDNQIGNIFENRNVWEVRYNILWRKENFLKMDRLEIKQDLTGKLSTVKGHRKEESTQFIANSSIDLYPFYSAIIRLKFQYKYYFDRLILSHNYSSTSFYLKLILRF